MSLPSLPLEDLGSLAHMRVPRSRIRTESDLPANWQEHDAKYETQFNKFLTRSNRLGFLFSFVSAPMDNGIS